MAASAANISALCDTWFFLNAVHQFARVFVIRPPGHNIAAKFKTFLGSCRLMLQVFINELKFLSDSKSVRRFRSRTLSATARAFFTNGSCRALPTALCQPCGRALKPHPIHNAGCMPQMQVPDAQHPFVPSLSNMFPHMKIDLFLTAYRRFSNRWIQYITYLVRVFLHVLPNISQIWFFA